MSTRLLSRVCIISLLIVACKTASAGEQSLFESKRVEPPQLTEPWVFTLETPGWLSGAFGDVGVNGQTSRVGIEFNEILRHTDFAVALAGEARRGRFGLLGGFLYVSASDGIGSNGPVSKLDFRFDEYLADLALSWRVVEGPKGWLDVLVGTRYVNLYQRISAHTDDEAIDHASERLVDAVRDRIRDRLEGRLNDRQFRESIDSPVADLVRNSLEALRVRNPPLPVGPLFAELPEEVQKRLRQIIEERTQEIAASLRRQRGLTATEFQTEVQRRVNAARDDLEKRIARTLRHKLTRTVSKDNDWFDPYIGFRGRYQLSPAFYLTARGDIGGFGIGSDLTWQVYGAFGCRLSRNVFIEAGYRCLFIDYRKEGLIYDVATRGPQVSVGITF